jgi:reactive intermediate/imine deaminase
MRTLLLASLLAVAGCTEGPVAKQTIQMPGSLEGLPFSTAVIVDDVLYLSGQVGTVPGTNALIDGGIAAETRQTLENISRVLEYAGSSIDQVFKCTVFLADIAEFQDMNAVYREFFPENPPARSAVAGSGLALDARVEIECMAVVAEQ